MPDTFSSDALHYPNYCRESTELALAPEVLAETLYASNLQECDKKHLRSSCLASFTASPSCPTSNDAKARFARAMDSISGSCAAARKCCCAAGQSPRAPSTLPVPAGHVLLEQKHVEISYIGVHVSLRGLLACTAWGPGRIRRPDQAQCQKVCDTLMQWAGLTEVVKQRCAGGYTGVGIHVQCMKEVLLCGLPPASACNFCQHACTAQRLITLDHRPVRTRDCTEPEPERLSIANWEQPLAGHRPYDSRMLNTFATLLRRKQRRTAPAVLQPHGAPVAHGRAVGGRDLDCAAPSPLRCLQVGRRHGVAKCLHEALVHSRCKSTLRSCNRRSDADAQKQRVPSRRGGGLCSPAWSLRRTSPRRTACVVKCTADRAQGGAQRPACHVIGPLARWSDASQSASLF